MQAEKKGAGILRMLDRLFSTKNTLEDKLDSLKNDFGVAVTKDEKEVVRTMCNYSDAIWKGAHKKGVKTGRRKGRQELAMELARKYSHRGMSVEQISDDLGYPADKITKWIKKVTV